MSHRIPTKNNVRNLPRDVDATITAHAKAAGKSKSDYIQAYLSASFGDLMGNLSRSSELVALMDRELAAVTGLPLTDNWYDAGHTLTENREYCHLLQIRSEGDLQLILMAAVLWLTLRVQQLNTGIPLPPQGISLTCALFSRLPAGNWPTCSCSAVTCSGLWMKRSSGPMWMPSGRRVCCPRWRGRNTEKREGSGRKAEMACHRLWDTG